MLPACQLLPPVLLSINIKNYYCARHNKTCELIAGFVLPVMYLRHELPGYFVIGKLIVRNVFNVNFNAYGWFKNVVLFETLKAMLTKTRFLKVQSKFFTCSPERTKLFYFLPSRFRPAIFKGFRHRPCYKNYETVFKYPRRRPCPAQAGEVSGRS